MSITHSDGDIWAAQNALIHDEFVSAVAAVFATHASQWAATLAYRQVSVPSFWQRVWHTVSASVPTTAHPSPDSLGDSNLSVPPMIIPSIVAAIEDPPCPKAMVSPVPAMSEDHAMRARPRNHRHPLAVLLVGPRLPPAPLP
jgi:hypothetical protein